MDNKELNTELENKLVEKNQINNLKANYDTIYNIGDIVSKTILNNQGSIVKVTRQTENFGKQIASIIQKIDVSSYVQQMIKMTEIIQPILEQQKNIAIQLAESLKPLAERMSKIEFEIGLTGNDVDLLNNFYWVIPYEYEHSKIRKLSKYTTKAEFDNYITKYFNDNRVKRLFRKCRNLIKNSDKKELLKQIEENYFKGNYAICITALITLLDGLTLQLITQDSEKQHLSYKAIDGLLEYLNERPINEFSYELYLKVEIINNFYNKLYDSTNKLKEKPTKKLVRHINSHGVWYSNDRINVLRLLNVIYMCQDIIIESEQTEKFVAIDKKIKINGKTRKSVMFKKKEEQSEDKS